jgi:hypothetical protein
MDLGSCPRTGCVLHAHSRIARTGGPATKTFVALDGPPVSLPASGGRLAYGQLGWPASVAPGFAHALAKLSTMAVASALWLGGSSTSTVKTG